MTINDYYVQKREVYYKLKGFADILEKEGRALTAEEDALYKDAVNKLNEIQQAIDTMKQMDEIRSQMNEPVKNAQGQTVGTVEERQIMQSGAVNKWMRHGMEGLTAEERKLINPQRKGSDEQIEIRAIGTVANPSYTYATDVMAQLKRLNAIMADGCQLAPNFAPAREILSTILPTTTPVTQVRLRLPVLMLMKVQTP